MMVRSIESAIGTLRRFLFSALCLCVFLPKVLLAAESIFPEDIAKYTTPRNPVYHALLLANHGYISLKRIESAQADMDLMKRFFERAGYRIWTTSDGQFQNVDEVYELLAKAKAEIATGDVVVIYYSGHGFLHGYQNWLVPLEYPTGTLDAQVLYKYALGLNDIVADLAERRLDYVVAILDSCRTVVEFPLVVKNETIKAKSSVLDTSFTGFSEVGSSITDTLIGMPTGTGGQAFAVSTEGKPSLFTGALAAVLEVQTQVTEVESNLRVMSPDVRAAHNISNQDFDPHFSRASRFDFSPVASPELGNRWETKWRDVLREPSRRLVRSYLLGNPGSQYSTMAWKYMDDHKDDLVDNAGFTATDPIAIDQAFVPGLESGKLIAVATPAFTAKFPRDMTGLQSIVAREPSDSIAYAEKSDQFAKIFEQRYLAAGSRLNFDAQIVANAKILTGNTAMIARAEPEATAPSVAEFSSATSLVVSETRFDEVSKKLYANVTPELGVSYDNSGSWVAFDYKANTPRSYNVLNRALEELYLSPDDLEVTTGNPISEAYEGVRSRSAEILWVSIASYYRPTDLSELRRQFDAAPSDENRAAIAEEIKAIETKDEFGLAQSRLRAQSARLQLIALGVEGSRISMISVDSADIGDRVRLRFFGSR